MITSLIPNFGHINKSTILFESGDKVFLVTSLAKILTSEPVFKNAFILRRPGVAKFASIIKNAIMLIKRINKSKKYHKLCIKMQFSSLFPSITKTATREKS